MNRKTWTKALAMLLLVAMLIQTVYAGPIGWDGTGSDYTGNSNISASGYAVDSTSDDCTGYRVSIISAKGTTLVGGAINIMRTRSDSHGNFAESDYFFTTKSSPTKTRNRVQWYKDSSAELASTKASSTSNWYWESAMGFLTTLPSPSTVLDVFKAPANLNKVLAKMNVGTVDDLPAGSKVLVEPMFSIRINNNYWYDMTVPEIAIFAKFMGWDMNGVGNTTRRQGYWGYIQEHTNNNFPHSLQVTQGMSGCWNTPSSSATSGADVTFNKLLNEGYGLGLIWGSLDTYVVSYNANGGSGSMEDSIATYNQAFMTRKNTFTRSGYIFNGWNEKADGTGTAWTLSSAGVYESGKSWTYTYKYGITLYAQWKPAKYTLTLKTTTGVASFTGGGTFDPGTLAYSTATASTGYHLTKYTGTTSDGSGTSTWTSCADLTTHQDNWTMNADRTITAYADPNYVVVLYYPNGGTVSGSGYGVATDTYPGAITANNSPWFHQIRYGKTSDPYNATTFGLTRPGYTFKGWALYNITDGQTDTILDQDTVYDSTKYYYYRDKTRNTSNLNNFACFLYAVWEPNTVSNEITHWLWGFTSAGNNKDNHAYKLGETWFAKKTGETFKLDESYATTIPNGTYLGSQFGPSYISGTWASYDIGTEVTQQYRGMDFEYDYYPYTYKITYQLNGGTNAASNPSTYTVLNGVTFAEPTRAGYTFAGWTIDGKAVTGINPGATEVFTSAEDLYAQLETRTTGDKTVVANWLGDTVKYHVYHAIWDGSDIIDLLDEEDVQGTSGETVAVSSLVKEFPGYTYDTALLEGSEIGSFTVVDGLEVWLLYLPNSHKVTLIAGTGITGTSGGGIYGFEDNVTIRATIKNGYRFVNWTGTGLTSPITGNPYKFVMPDNDVTLTANAEIINYKITYYLEGGTVSPANPTSYNVETPTFKLNNPTRPGYVFTGWDGSNGDELETDVSVVQGVTGDLEFTAHWEPSTKTPYKVRHYVETTDGTGWDLYRTEDRTGTTGATITVEDERLAITGCSYKEGRVNGTVVTTATVAADGSLVIDLYYTRNIYTVTLIAGTGISGTSGAGQYRYGASVTIDATVMAGYNWAQWKPSGIAKPIQDQKYTFTMPAQNKTFTATATVSHDTPYKVNHYTESVDGSSWQLHETEDLTGTTGASLVLDTLQKTITGFTYKEGKVNGATVTTATVAADGSLVIDLYYVRNEYKVTLTAGTGISGTTGAGTYKYGQTVKIDAAVSSGYVWVNWTGTGITTPQTTKAYTFTMPANDVSLTANAKEGTDTPYVVRHYTENLDGTSWTLESTENKTGTTGQTLTVANLKKSITGFTYKEGKVGGKTVTTATVAADGSLVIDLYYSRNSYKVTLTAGTGISGTTGAGTYKYGQTVKIDATVKTGYAWTNWTGTGITTPQTTKAYTFTMPANDVSLTANAKVIVYNITYDLQGGTVNGTNPATYTAETPTFTLINPTKQGYVFTGWTGSNGTTAQTSVSVVKGTTGDLHFTANWKAGTGIPYVVNHYTENLNGTSWTLNSTDNLQGTTGQVLTVANMKKAIAGFTYKEGKVGGTTVTTATVAADGSLVIDLYYTRSSYKVTLTAGTGISGTSGAGTYKYGQSVKIDATVKTGYTWTNWTGSGITTPQATKAYTFTMPANDVSLTANAKANTDTPYVIRHYTEDLDGTTWTLYETENKKGTTDTTLTLADFKKTITGFTYKEGQVDGKVVTTTTLRGDGKLVIDLYYVRNEY